MKYKAGNKVYCKIRGNVVVSVAEGNYDVQLPFDIIGHDEKNSKYVILIPKYYNIKNSWNITEEHIDKFDIHPNHLDEKAIYIQEDRILKAQSKQTGVDGMVCDRCDEFFPMAEANQHNGTMICWSCRSNPYR